MWINSTINSLVFQWASLDDSVMVVSEHRVVQMDVQVGIANGHLELLLFLIIQWCLSLACRRFSHTHQWESAEDVIKTIFSTMSYVNNI